MVHIKIDEQRHQSGWRSFTKAAGYATAGVITILILMAIFLT